jgi:hypothetical protein
MAVFLFIATGCVLRPQYRDVVGVSKPVPGAASEVQVRVVEERSGQPIPGATLAVGDNPRTRVVRTTDAGGMTTLPVNTALFGENGMVVVTLPPGFGRYRIERMETPETIAPPTEPAPAAPPVEEVVDAGVEPVPGEVDAGSVESTIDAGTTVEASDAGM